MSRCACLYVVIFGMLTLLNAACIKAPLADREVYGQMVDSATHQPLSTATFILVRNYKSRSFNGVEMEEVFSFATDNSGNFRVKFKASKKEEIYITHPNVSIYDAGYQFWSDVTGPDKVVNAGVIKAYLK